jgi:hypothetical protein
MGTVGDRLMSLQQAAHGETITCLGTGFLYAMSVNGCAGSLGKSRSLSGPIEACGAGRGREQGGRSSLNLNLRVSRTSSVLVLKLS